MGGSPKAHAGGALGRSGVRADAALLRRLYLDQGLTVAGVAARLGVAHGTAHKWLVDAGVPMRANPYDSRADVSEDDVRRLYEDGWTATEIASRLGCGSSTVYNRLERLGVSRRRRGTRRTLRPSDDHLRRLYQDEGLSLRQMARRFSVTPQAISGWLKAAGVPRRAPASPIVDRIAVASLYERTRSGQQVARQLGCSPVTVYRQLEAAGTARDGGAPYVDRAQLIEGLDAGLSAPLMAARFGVSVSAVCRALVREGLETATQAGRRQAAERLDMLRAAVDRTASTAMKNGGAANTKR